MKKRLFLNIFALLTIATMIFAVVGVQLRYHTCGKTGERTFKIVETAECACESEVKESTCCHSGEGEINVCHLSSQQDDSNKMQNLSKMSCCQDEVFYLSMNEVYVNSVVKNLQTANFISQINDYITVKIKLDEYKNKLNQAKTLFKIPKNISLEIIRIMHRSELKDSDPLSI